MNFDLLFATWQGRHKVGELLLARGDTERGRIVAQLSETDRYMSLMVILRMVDAMTSSPQARKHFERIVRQFERDISK